MHKDMSYLGGVIAMANRHNETDHNADYVDTFKACLNDLVDNCTHSDRCDALNEVDMVLSMNMDDAWQRHDYREFGLLMRVAVQKLMQDQAGKCTDNVLSTRD